MARRKKSGGFNTPFEDLKLPAKPPEPKPERAAEPQGDGPEPADEALFAGAMAGVMPMDRTHSRVEPPKRSKHGNPDEDALAVAELEALVKGELPFRLEETGDVTWGGAPGVSNEIIERLKGGRFAFRRHVDLHGLSREDARAELQQFISAARLDGHRCVLVVTGRGKGSPGGVAVLKEALPRWLSRAPLRPHVLAFCTARRVDGGPGAFYVLLRRAGSRPNA